MKAVFLSDAHLWSERDEGYVRLLIFFRELRGRIDHLVVAGDLFDFWFCDENNLYPEFDAVVEELFELKKSGVTISLIEGNHDFFLEAALGKMGLVIYRDEAVFDMDGLRIYVAHGDSVDGTNRSSLLLRRILRSDVIFALQKWIPSSILWRIARVSSNSSRQYQKKDYRAMVAAMEEFSREKIARGMDAVIFGHSHQVCMERIVLEERRGTFVLLGDWIQHYSYLLLQDGRFSLESYDRDRRLPWSGAL